MILIRLGEVSSGSLNNSQNKYFRAMVKSHYNALTLALRLSPIEKMVKVMSLYFYISQKNREFFHFHKFILIPMLSYSKTGNPSNNGTQRKV